MKTVHLASLLRWPLCTHGRMHNYQAAVAGKTSAGRIDRVYGVITALRLIDTPRDKLTSQLPQLPMALTSVSPVRANSISSAAVPPPHPRVTCINH